MTNQSTVLVAGGAGYIGSLVNKELNRAGYLTIVYDNLCSGDKSSVIAGKFIEGDIGDEAALDQLFSRHSIDAVMHFAAHSDVEESVRNPAKYYRNNVANTLTLLETQLKYSIKYFVFSSSAAIFGQPRESLISEDHPRFPINPYGESKLMVEKILHDYEAAYGLRYCSLRYFNAAGGDPEGHIKHVRENDWHLIPVILRQMKHSHTPITIFGTNYPTRDGTCVRDYVHVSDLADAHIKGLQKLLNEEVSGVYNLGSARGFTVREVIEAAIKATGLPLSIIEGKQRPGDPHTLIANGQKAARELGWHPQFSLEDMIKHAGGLVE
ncbi:MAG: UDP-glucose 4-epimerase GalE [Waddliaceae bacterium]